LGLVCLDLLFHLFFFAESFTEALISWFEAGEKKVVAEKPDPSTEHSLGADPCHECRWRQAASKYQAS